MPPRHVRYHRTGSNRLRHNPALLLSRPAPAPDHATAKLHSPPDAFCVVLQVDHRCHTGPTTQPTFRARRHQYSATWGQRTAYEHIVVLLGDDIVADHPRNFRRDQIVYDPWHYLPVLMKKPGALCNGAPFKDWALPPMPGTTRP